MSSSTEAATPKYQYTQNPKNDHGAIHITEGHYKDLVYSYGMISFSKDTENPSVNFTYDIIDNPNSVAQDQTLMNLMGRVLTDIIEKNAEEVQNLGTNRTNNTSQSGEER